MSVSLALDESLISKIMCFPWWYYTLFDISSAVFVGLLILCLRFANHKYKYIESHSDIIFDKQKESIHKKLKLYTKLPNVLIHEILSYIPYEPHESKSFEIHKYLHDRIEARIAKLYIILYELCAIIINIYVWYIAIKSWFETFKFIDKGWDRFIIILFDSMFIIPSFMPYNSMANIFISSEIIFNLEMVDPYLSKKWWTVRCFDVPIIWIISVILQIQPWLWSLMISTYLIFVPGAILFIPITLIVPVSWCLTSLVTYLGNYLENNDYFDDNSNPKCHLISWICFIILFVLIGFFVATLLYWEALWIFLSTNCFYKKNRWDKCIKYAFESQYCPHFTFDYSFDAWILIIKWVLFK